MNAAGPALTFACPGPRRSTYLALVLCAVVVFAGHRATADERPSSDLRPLHAAIAALVHTHYPGAIVTVNDHSIRFEFNTRVFLVHELNRIGDRWQEAHEEAGPQPGGIHGHMELRPGPYAGTAVLPQDFSRRYFTVYIAAPYSGRLDHHLYVRLKYPDGAPPPFVSEFKRLTERFDVHVARRAR
jgi:hypothetical protein